MTCLVASERQPADAFDHGDAERCSTDDGAPTADDGPGCAVRVRYLRLILSAREDQRLVRLRLHVVPDEDHQGGKKADNGYNTNKNR